MIRISGPWVDALRRYDPRLRVRWSYERKSYCIDYPTLREDMLPPPVRYEKHGDKIVEIRVPELSERYITYHDKRFPVLYADEIGKKEYLKVLSMDRKKKELDDRIRDMDANRKALKRSETVAELEKGREAFDRLKFAEKTCKQSDEFGSGYLTKEERAAQEAKFEEKTQSLLEDA